MEFKVNKNWDRAYKILTPLIIFGFLGYVLGNFIASHYPAISWGNSFVILALALVIGFFLHAVIHEAGHYFFGRLSGYTFQSFRIGNRMWVKEDGKLEKRKLTVTGTGGQCIMIPPDPVDGMFPYRLYNLGGVLANLIAAALFALLAVLTLSSQHLSLFLLFLSFVGLLMAYMNGVPMTTGLLDNDARNVKHLKEDPHARRSFWIQLKVQEQLAKGVRLKDMPAEWFELPQDMALDNSLNAALAVLGTNRLMDEGKLREADEAMAKLLESRAALAGLHRNLMISDRIFIEVVLRNFPDRLDKLITKSQRDFMKAMTEYPSVIRTEYAHALISQKDAEKAQRFRAKFEEMAQSYPHPVEVESERDMMDLADEALERHQRIQRGRKTS